jgi:hypothetical protein
LGEVPAQRAEATRRRRAGGEAEGKTMLLSRT